MAIPKKLCGIPFPLALAVALVLAYAWLFGRATIFVWQIKKDAARNPTLAVVPVPLSDTSISTARGSTLTKFGYQFDVPWKMKETKEAATIAIFGSESGQEAIMFWDPAEKKGLVRRMKETPGAQLGALASVYGARAMQSDYDFYRAVANATPSQLSYVLPRRKEVRAAVFLMLKPIEMIDSETGFYSFETQNLRAFKTAIPRKQKT